MCGRLNIIDDPITQFVSDVFGLSLNISTNKDFRPSQKVACLSLQNSSLTPVNASWGIKPSWSKRLLINAQAETVATKKTFRDAFKLHRCLVPCMGWYEWKDRQKYLFEPDDGLPFLMAGLLYFEDDGAKLVTLTRSPVGQSAEIHSRMPLTIAANHSDFWFQSEVNALGPLLDGEEAVRISIHLAA